MPDLFIELLHPEDASGVTPAPLDENDALAMLESAEFSAAQLIPWGSNYSFAVALQPESGREQLAVYKPRAGEAPLYDFPDGTLFLREIAAYQLSKELGWNIVPPTVMRDGPHGIGSLQLYVEPMSESESWDPRQFWGRCALEIERIVLFDHITNNADRKLSHCLRDVRGKVWGIDHGLTFNEYPKLRTALWQFVGKPINRRLLDDLTGFLGQEDEMRLRFSHFLTSTELDALMVRIGRFVEMGHYPRLNPRRNIPYGWW
jgi:uncharacterized repeat protein (TIGR03843 family)